VKKTLKQEGRKIGTKSVRVKTLAVVLAVILAVTPLAAAAADYEYIERFFENNPGGDIYAHLRVEPDISEHAFTEFFGYDANELYLADIYPANGQVFELLLIPQFITADAAANLSVYVTPGTLAWNANEGILTGTALTYDASLGGILIQTRGTGWFTVFSRGTDPATRSGFYRVHTYIYVPESYFIEGVPTQKNLPIENTRRAPAFQSQWVVAPGETPPIRHEFESHNPDFIVRKSPIMNRFGIGGNQTIAAAPVDAAGNRLPNAPTWALGSAIAPWSGPGHFQTPMFRNQIFCPTTGVLIGLVDESRPLMMWTTHSERTAFMHELNVHPINGANAWVLNAGFAPHTFPDIADPFYFQAYFMVFTATDLTGITCYQEAGALVQANGRPTIWINSDIHGNEHGAGEGLLVLMYSLAATPWGAEVVEDVNIVLYPGVNSAGNRQHRRWIMPSPEERTAAGRPSQGQTDGNRDWTIQNSQELRQVVSVFHSFMPEVAFENHERGANAAFAVTGANAGWSGPVPGNNDTGGSGADDFQVSLHNSPDMDERQVALAAEMMGRMVDDSFNSGIRIFYYDILVENPSIGSYWFGMHGGLSFIPEFPGQSNGGEIRRVFGGYVTFRSAIEFTREHAGRVHDTVAAVRADMIEHGRTYDPNRVITLGHTNASRSPASEGLPISRDERTPEIRRYRIHMDGSYEHTGTHRLRAFDVLSYRSAPTGYIVPLEIYWDTHPLLPQLTAPHTGAPRPYRPYADAVARLRTLLSDNNAEYFIIHSDDLPYYLPLQQYYVYSAAQPNAMARGFQAGLRTRADANFTGEVLFVPMDQVARLMIAHVMEPDMDKATLAGWEGNNNLQTGGSHAISWVQAMITTGVNPVFNDGSRTLLHNPDNMNLPIFRLIEDNPREFMGVIYEPAPPPPPPPTPPPQPPQVETAALSALVAAAVGRQAGMYTVATFTPFNEAIAAAQAILADANATQVQIDAAYAQLRSAMAALVARPTGGPWWTGGPAPQPPPPPEVEIEEGDVPLAETTGFAAFIQGHPDNTFRGAEQISREEFITILFRLHNPDGLPEENSERQSFTDVAPDRWSFDAIEWAVSAGIIESGAAAMFLPRDELTRAEMAVMLVRAEGWTEGAEDRFSDIEDHELANYVLKAAYAGIFEGFPDGTFRPDATATRFEMVTALTRYVLGRAVEDEMIEGVEFTLTDVPPTHWAFRYVVLATVGF